LGGRGTHAPPPTGNVIFLRYYSTNMPKISVEVPEELLADLDAHVGEGGKFVNRSEAIRASIRKTLDQLDEIDRRHGRIDDGD
jgi:Arc/MetJ-type ribon-helix-helix transcriptional regulator